jgi:hypothetical protein
MDKINPTNALYIKLGRGGEYEQECLASPGMLRIGWVEVPHALCMAGDWEQVRQIELKEFHESEIVASSQTNQLRQFYESGEDILWITFSKDRLHWCFAKKEIILQPDNSRIRLTTHGWSNCDIKGNTLDTSRLSGSLSAIQGFRSAICKVREFEYLVRKINCESSPAEQKASEARETLIQSLVEIIQSLNWKEFELLTDLIFRQAGWQRLGVLGKTTKGIDLDLLSPINLERYRVQVKSAAGIHEFQSFLSLATDDQGFARYYFVVHNPEGSLLKEVDNPLVKVWLPDDIARHAVNYGLADWLIGKAK